MLTLGGVIPIQAKRKLVLRNNLSYNLNPLKGAMYYRAYRTLDHGSHGVRLKMVFLGTLGGTPNRDP